MSLPQDPRSVCRELAILYNLQTLRQRRQIYDWTKIVAQQHVFVKLAHELQKMIALLNQFDEKLSTLADFIYRQETEPAVRRAEEAHQAAAHMAALDRMGASEYLTNTLATIGSLRKRKYGGEGVDQYDPETLALIGRDALWEDI